VIAEHTSGNRRCRGRRPILVVSFLYLGAHRLEALAFVDHFHHVTRDADADASSQAHPIEYEIGAGRAVFEIARCIARVALCTAAAITRDKAESILIGNRETICFADFFRSLRDVGW
jgi:hypothetical protein